jgi:sugar O-acyltransferase (sialic acid O-acetyltransferase NeuD family)
MEQVSGAIRRIAIVGAGGFAREVAWLIRDINRAKPTYELAGFIISDPTRLGDHDSRDQVLGGYDWIDDHKAEIDALAIGVGNPQSRRKIASELEVLFPRIEWPALIHPTSQLDCPSAQIGRGVILCAGVIGTVNLVLEPFSKVDTACTIGHEARIGAYSALNPSANISGGVDVGQEVLVGTGAQILQYIQIGDGATVGAGAVVTKDVPAGQTVVGIPARSLQQKESLSHFPNC